MTLVFKYETILLGIDTRGIMRDFLIKMLAQKVGLTNIPKTQQEFFNMVANNSTFQNDLKKAEDLGYIRKDDSSGSYVINMDKVDGFVKNYISSLL